MHALALKGAGRPGEERLRKRLWSLGALVVGLMAPF